MSCYIYYTIYKEQMMIDVQLEDFFPWLQQKYEEKYGEKLEQLKSTFLMFYNLTHQIISIYHLILEECSRSSDYGSGEQLEALKVVVNRTMIILHKLIENEKIVKNKPGAIDMTFCERFIKNFGENLNILCTYYHSLNHCEIVGASFKFEKKKIVQGINKLYTIHNKIRELYYKNDDNLKNIENHKLYAIINISHILLEREALFKDTRNVFFTLEDQVADFYASFQDMLRFGKSNSAAQEGPNLDTDEQAIKKLMKNYFRILHQFSEAQAELEYYLKPVLSFCEQIKNKKKSMNYAVADSINIFSRTTSQLLKSNYSLKNFKKIRMEDLSKALFTILEDIVLNNAGSQFRENNQMLGHRIYKQLGFGLLRNQHKNSKSNEKQGSREREQKQAQREKEKQKEKEKYRNKEKGRQKKGGQSSQKEGSRSGAKIRGGENASSKSKQGRSQEKQDSKSSRSESMRSFQEESEREQILDEEQIGVQGQFLSETPQQKIQLVVDEICECAVFIMDCMRQLEKVQSSGLLNMIQEYKEKLNVSNPTSGSQSALSNATNSQYQCSRKVIVKLCEYQKYISSFYKLNENIKQFQKVMREIILQEFRIKVNIVISLEPRTVAKHVEERRKEPTLTQATQTTVS